MEKMHNQSKVVSVHFLYFFFFISSGMRLTQKNAQHLAR